MPSAAPTATVVSGPTVSPAESPSAGETASPGEETPTPAETSAAPTPSPTPTATPTPTPTPSPTPTPGPTANHVGDRTDVAVTQYYGRTSPQGLPEGVAIQLKYNKYWTGETPLNYLDYFIVAKSSVARELPDNGAKALQQLRTTDRLPLLAAVTGTDGKSQWYRVYTAKGEVGYVPASAGWPDSFKLEQALAEIKKLKTMADQPGTQRIVNYNNVHGKPPAFQGKQQDNYGVQREQAAPAYLAPDASSSFRYAADGTLCQVFGASGDFSQVYFPAWDEVRYVPTKYLTKSDPISKLTQAIVVNRNPHGQNIMVFELIEDQWTIVSLCFVSTGANKSAEKPTPLGDFFTEKHTGRLFGIGEFFFFPDGAPQLDDTGKQRFSGYAPWAIRFTGGAYLHGMPMGVDYDATGTLVKTTRTSEVYGSFIGTTPASHMCVRNYTSHAKFMYDWVKDGQAAVIVIE